MAKSISHANKKTHTIVPIFINNYLLVYMCPRYILSDNGMKSKYQLMDDVLWQFGINHIFSAPYQPQSNRKLDVFYKYLKPTLTKLYENDLDNWDQYLNQVLTSYCVTPNPTMGETPFFLIYRRDPNLPLHQLLEPMQCFFSDPDFLCLNLEMHCLALDIANKILDKNWLKMHRKQQFILHLTFT